MTTGTTDTSTYAAEQASLAQVLAIAATIEAVRTRAAQMGITVGKTTPPGAPIGADADPGDLYGPADEN
jgi:hypothetical protein